MKTTKNVWILVIWLSLTVLQVEISTQNSWNWFEAQQLCKENNDSLPKPNTFSSWTRQHWTSQYRRYSFWIKILGCYNDTEPDDTQTFQMDIPSAGFCQEICATVNSSTFGIKKECKCFGNLFMEQPVSQNHCNMVHQTTGRFTELGSINAYTLYESDFNVTKRDKIYCVAIQCHKHKQFYFVPDANCSLSFGAVCQNSVSKSYQNWTSSMQLCKKENSSYLAGNISLNDIDQTCDRLNVTLTGPSWLGVAKELYMGSDRGVPVKTEEMKSFLQCVKCQGDYCGYFVNCTERLDTVYCEKGFSTATIKPATAIDKHGTTWSVSLTSDISTQTSESLTASSKPGTTQSVTYTSDAFKHTPETSTSKQGINNSSNTLSIILPVVVTVVLIGCFATAAVFYIRRKRGLRNQNNIQLDSNDTDNNYTDIDIDVKNKNYFVLETNYSSSHVQTDESNPYKDISEGIYDHLRDKESRKRNEKDGKANDSNLYKETDGGLYDHLRDMEFGKSTEENDYDHAPPAPEQDYSAQGRMNEHTFNTEYDHSMSFYDYKQHDQVIEETDGGYAKTVNVS
ncbi:uncharacterized protein LOC125663540 isoform X2 [Ostrea edulis]|uniref:uncharacterized protein LOC125663540 isoform X2 n=1 Tax=Ostrea edulis TaxID=37623 RepID=UPI0024AF3B79|nr:uncharacterized protein LOC125663540 isoform X2 [Ostrea edulis]